MKVNKDTVGGFIAGILALLVIAWGVIITLRVNDVTSAHNNLVKVLTNQAAKTSTLDVQKSEVVSEKGK